MFRFTEMSLCVSSHRPMGTAEAVEVAHEAGRESEVVAQLRIQLSTAEASALRWRKEVGRLTCATTGRGPTGGFCMREAPRKESDHEGGSGPAGQPSPSAVSPVVQHRGNNYCMPHKLAVRLGELFGGHSVLDLGCGVGMYGAYFRHSAPSVRWVGIDGADGIEEHTRGLVRFAELTEGLPSDLRRPWGWKMSLEVAEHIPWRGEPTFIHSLLSDVQRGVVLSWARLNQSGLDHINCQDEAYVQCVMGLAGFALDANTTASLRDAITTRGRHLHTHICPWLKWTLFVFRPYRSLGGLGVSHDHRGPPAVPLPPLPSEEFASHYLAASKAHCPRVQGGCHQDSPPS